MALLIMMGLDLAVASGQGRRGPAVVDPETLSCPTQPVYLWAQREALSQALTCLSAPCTPGGITLGATV